MEIYFKLRNFIWKNAVENVIWEIVPIFLGLNVLSDMQDINIYWLTGIWTFCDMAAWSPVVLCTLIVWVIPTSRPGHGLPQIKLITLSKLGL